MSARHTIMKSLLVLPALALLGGCSIYEDGHITQEKIQVRQERYTEQIPVEEFDKNAIKAMSNYYNRYGSGPMGVSVTYSPRSTRYTAMDATTSAAEFVGMFRENGISAVTPTILTSLQQPKQVIVTFETYKAEENYR